MLKLKENFRLGVSSASMQIEGGQLNSNWHDWAAQNKIKDGSTPANANDHYYRYHEDFLIMQEMGIKDYRFSVEWSRIEPEEGEFDTLALEHYRTMIIDMKSLGIRPLLTLWHFSHPMWFEDKKGFLNAGNIQYFMRYVGVVIEYLGDLVDEYITINEPNVYAIMGYLFNEWPPSNNNGFAQVFKVMSVLSTVHIQTYKHIKEMLPHAQVGYAHHVRHFTGQPKVNVKMARYLFQDALAIACMTGEFKMPLRNIRRFKKGIYVDFIGINYYTQTTINNINFDFSKDLPKNDLGWDIYPEGLARVIREVYDICQKPIYITENGTCDNDDRFRARYLADHLEVITKMGLPVERYYQWSFSDNFEWVEGESSRFGLVHIDYETQARTIKRSGYFYKDLIKNHGITQQMVQEYLVGSAYDTHQG